MKRLLLVAIYFCVAVLTGCKKDDGADKLRDGAMFSLLNGAIIINHNPNVTIEELNEYPVETGTMPAVDIKSGIKLTSDDDALQANNYRFKLVAEMSALILTDDTGVERQVQAAEVKVSDDGYVFVAYNHRTEPNIGGLVVYKYTVTGGALKDVTVHLTPVSSIKLRRGQINAIDIYGNKLYIAGASQEPALGYKGADPAFYLVMELDADRKFKAVEPENIKYLTSFQANSIRKYQDRIYITTGDGTQGSRGGLYIFDANNYNQVKFIEKQHARSVDIDESGVYLMQANHARVSKYDFDGNAETPVYNVNDEAMQKDAKSQVLAWKNYLFLAQNETGLKMLNKNSFNSVNDLLGPPNNNIHKEWDVTNGVNINSDAKISSSGRAIETDLLLLANGRQGLYWYDIMTDANGKEVIMQAQRNRILAEVGRNSTNFVASKGNVAFVANGLGGLKVLYIGLRDRENEDNSDCVSVCEYYIYTDGGAVALNSDNQQIGITRFRLIDDCENIEHAFCADINTPCYEGQRYKCTSSEEHLKNGEATKIMAAFTYIMNEYGWMETTNVHGYRQMMQTTAWRIIHNTTFIHLYNVQGTLILNAVNYIYDNIDAITAAYNSGVTITGNDTGAKDGTFVKYGPYQITNNILLNGIDFDLAVNLAANSAEFVNEAGVKITKVKPGNSFYLRVADNYQGNVKIAAVASESQQLNYVYDHRFYIEINDNKPPYSYQPLFQELAHPDARTYFYSAERILSY